MSQRRSQTDYIVIHCSDTPPSMDIGAAEIDRWHRQKNYLEIGYQFVIRRDGRIEVGRDLLAPGAHAIKVNRVSVGVCLVGGRAETKGPEVNYTPAQWASLKQLVRTLTLIWPEAEVVGHEAVDDRGKTCPNFDAATWWAGMSENIDG